MTDPVSHFRPRIPKRGLAINVIGAGGVAAIFTRHLLVICRNATADAGNGPVTIRIVDADAFEPKNGERVLFKVGANPNKATTVVNELTPFTRGTRVRLLAVEQYLDFDNVAKLIREHSVTTLCVDNHASRRLAEEHCGGRLQNFAVLSGGSDPVTRTTSGNYSSCTAWIRANGVDLTPSLGRLHPELAAAPLDHHPAQQDCAAKMVSEQQLYLGNAAVALTLANMLFLYLCEPEAGSPHSELGRLRCAEVCMDIAALRTQPALPAPLLLEEQP